MTDLTPYTNPMSRDRAFLKGASEIDEVRMQDHPHHSAGG